ncbi:hypothetical protein F2Q69_00020547 [Brassica cretica]|uniref:Uncharacterized protein n=1 Tax=Brassica cretica TaxID=69181 RepID=A0A8S9Q491_BRACR|nr:hypothetical protein F2Q69_00020547 [Brassica cretica]
MTMNSTGKSPIPTGKSPVVLYFKAISAESELLSQKCVFKSSFPSFDVTYVVLHWQKIIIHQRIAFQFLLGSAYQFYPQPPTFIGNTPTIRPGAAPTAPDMRVRLSQIEPDFLTRD